MHWFPSLSISLIRSSPNQLAKVLIPMYYPSLWGDAANHSFHRRSLLVEGIRNSRSTSIKLKKDALSISLMRWWLLVVSVLPCRLNPIKSNASLHSNLIPFILKHLCIALTQVSRYCESRLFLSPLLRFSGASILIPFICLHIFDYVSGVTILVIISYCCCSGILPRSVHFLIFLTFFGLRILLWLWTDDPLLELPLLELLSYPSSSPPPGVVPHPKVEVWSSSPSPFLVLPASKVRFTMSSSGTMPLWDPVLTSGADRCLVGVSGGSLLSYPLRRLAIGGSSNCPGTTGKRRCWPHSMKDIISSHSFRT